MPAIANSLSTSPCTCKVISCPPPRSLLFWCQAMWCKGLNLLATRSLTIGGLAGNICPFYHKGKNPLFYLISVAFLPHASKLIISETELGPVILLVSHLQRQRTYPSSPNSQLLPLPPFQPHSSTKSPHHNHLPPSRL
jgi:hypothetical protein